MDRDFLMVRFLVGCLVLAVLNVLGDGDEGE